MQLEKDPALGLARFLPLTYCFVLIFGVGAPGILITRALLFYFHPEKFDQDSPTISEAASHWPNNILFGMFFTVVVACIFVSWTMNALRNNALIGKYRADIPTRFLALNWIASGSGIVAGIFLFSLSIFTLHGSDLSHDIHMGSSWGFYIAQVLSIILDIVFVLWLRRPDGGDVRGRAVIAGLILAGSLVFLYFFLNKNNFAAEVRYTVQLIYVGAENLLCLLCLAYPATLFREMRRDLRSMAAETIQPERISQPAEA